MPPKAKRGVMVSQKSESELSIDEKYKRSVNEANYLRDHLAAKKDLATRSQQACEEWKTRMKEVETDLEETRTNHRAVSANLSRQYKLLQSDMTMKLKQTEDELSRTKMKLEWTQNELTKTQNEKEKMSKEKDATIGNLNTKLATIITQYEIYFNNYMDELMRKMMRSKEQWEKEADEIHLFNKNLIMDVTLYSSSNN